MIKQAQEDVEKTPWNSPELQEYGSIMIEILGLVENMNPPHLLLSSEKKDALVAREMIKVYALLGANEDRAFRRSSKA